LVVGLFVSLALSLLASSFYFRSINENTLALRERSLIRAFWIAEAGVAEAIDNLPGSSVSGQIGASGNTYSAQVTATGSDVYTIVSTGTVTLPSGETVSRSVSVDVRTGTVPASNFQYAIETTTDLVIKGSVDINPDDKAKEFSTLDFAALFGYTKDEIKANATHYYTDENFSFPVDGITWVDVDAGETMVVAGNLSGSGILIVSGNVHFSGTLDFNGIIYVIGKLTMSGTVTTYGSVMAESSTTVDTVLKGNVELNWDEDEINAALDLIRMLRRDIVSWKEL